MRKVTCRVYTPDERLPISSTPLDEHIVLVKVNRHGYGGPSWFRGTYMGKLGEWRIVGENYAEKVLEWMEIPT